MQEVIMNQNYGKEVKAGESPSDPPVSLTSRMPLNSIGTHENLLIHNMPTASINKSIGIYSEREVPKKQPQSVPGTENDTLSMLKNPKATQQRVLINSPPAEIFQKSVPLRRRVQSGTTSRSSGLTASRNPTESKGFEEEQEELSTDQEEFYEASPVLPVMDKLSTSNNESALPDTYDRFELNETIKFVSDTHYDLELNPEGIEETYYPTLLDETFSPIVEVAIEPMGRPLAPEGTPLNLKLVSLLQKETLLRKAAPFCNIHDNDTIKLLRILELEIENQDTHEDQSSEEDNSLRVGWLTRLRQAVLGYSESEYILANPWTDIIMESQEGDGSAGDIYKEEDFDEVADEA